MLLLKVDDVMEWKKKAGMVDMIFFALLLLWNGVVCRGNEERGEFIFLVLFFNNKKKRNSIRFFAVFFLFFVCRMVGKN